MAQLYQWTVPCIICESPVEYHCNTCGDVFCGKCREIHLKSKASRHHVIVPYSQRVEPTKSMECGDHPGHQCGVWCQTCNRAVCNECLISPRHRGHIFLKFDEKVGEKRREIQGQFETFSSLLTDWKNSLEEAKTLEKTYLKDVMHLDKEIVHRADELCKQVRLVEKESRKQLQEMKDASLRDLHVQQQTLTDCIEGLKKRIKRIEDTLRSSDTSAILHSSAEKNIETKPNIIDPPVVPVLTPGPVDKGVLQKMLGCLSVTRIRADDSKDIENKIISLLRDPSVESILYILKGHYYPYIACTGSGEAWVQTDDRSLQLLDRHGTVQRTVNIDFDLSDMALTTQGDILLTYFSNKCIRSISIQGDMKTLFRTEWSPRGICCLPGGDMVVAFTYEGRVVQYSSNGKIIKEMNKSMFQLPWFMAYSQVNQQLYICDKTEDEHFIFLSNPGRVLALDMNGTLQYTYTGPDKATFRPVDVSTDQAGYVLITDHSNNRVHILDKGGNFLQYLLTAEQGLKTPMTIDVDREGYAWITEYDTRKLKVVKYAK